MTSHVTTLITSHPVIVLVVLVLALALKFVALGMVMIREMQVGIAAKRFKLARAGARAA